jgi:hypothetical protein
MDTSDTDKPRSKATQDLARSPAQTAREARLAKALRVNLRRRKQGSDRPISSGE